MHPKNLSINDFTYHLPEERIARYPLNERDNSRLLVYKSGRIETSNYKEIANFLPPDTLLVFNNTKVVEARLLFQKVTGGVIEIFCLEPDSISGDITTAMLQKGKVRWKCLVGGASKWKHGMTLEKRIDTNTEVLLQATIVERLTDCFIIELTWQPNDLTFSEILQLAGIIPLPPYLHREPEDQDKDRYQTIYAHNQGSVAAPTAGLHFTEQVFRELASKGIQKSFVTLHVGAGTFKPVKALTMEEHEMHAEFLEVSTEAIEHLLQFAEKTIVAVGTTSLRTIESLYWMGVKVIENSNLSIDDISVQQWDPYESLLTRLTVADALQGLLHWMERKQLKRIVTKTQIIIAPGYKLKIANGIITNFHQPQSTLLLLVAAIIGDAWKLVYQYALDNDFRFLSYGDGCLLWKENN